MTSIQQQFSKQMTRSRRSLQKHTSLWLTSVADEARAWEALAKRTSRAALDSALEEVRPRTWERRVLTRVDKVLARVRTSVSERLSDLDGSVVTEPPIEGYEEMTAKAIVAELPRLTEADCAAIRDFEAQNKQRATVLRALEGRLAA